MLRVLALLLIGLPLAAQSLVGCYDVRRTGTLSGAGTVLTIQQPASNAANHDLRIVSVSMWASVDANFSIERTGTAASSTALTPTPLSSTTPAAAFNAFHSSNVGSGTQIGPTHRFTDGSSAIVVGFDSSAGGILLKWNGGTTANFSVRLASITGDYDMSIIVCAYQVN